MSQYLGLSPRASRKEANYDPDPPCCYNCVNRTRNTSLDGLVAVRWCSWHGFRLTTTHGICDEWRGKGGDRLEGAPPNLIGHLVAKMEKPHDALAKPRCRRCETPLEPGIALAQTFSCSDEGTCSPAGPGKVVPCLKCPGCGHSVTE